MITPIERVDDIWVKRDDLYVAPGGALGGKARTCLALARAATAGLVTAGSRSSPQVAIVARIGQALGMPVRVHVPTGKPGLELEDAEQHGAEIITQHPGYNTVLCARAVADAKARDWTYIPFGMETPVAAEQTATQVTAIPDDVSRIVVPVGSAMSLAGVICGVRGLGRQIPILGVVVGADPTSRLHTYAPIWATNAELVRSEHDYAKAVEGQLGDISLDPIYEAKCLPHLREGDLFWIVGRRMSSQMG